MSEEKVKETKTKKENPAPDQTKEQAAEKKSATTKKATEEKKAEVKAEAKAEKPKAEAKPKKETKKEESKAEAKAEPKKKEPAKDESKKEEAKPAAKKEAATPKAESTKEEATVEEPFSWDNLTEEGFGQEYSAKEREEMAKMYEGTINQVEEKQLITGSVVGITAKDVILNIGYKSDGLVSLSEFKDLPDLKVGDDVEVYLETQEDKSGQVVISRRKANIVKAWEAIQNSHEKDSVIEGFVKRRTKGGLIVDIFGIEAFLPGSQIDVKPIRDFDVFVGKTMEVKVVKINYSNDNVVVSHKVLIEKDIEAQKAEILNNLEKGQVLEGIVKNMTNFGVFIDLGGVDGLLHITDISWGRINHPEEVLKLDEKVQVVVLDFDDGKKRISLGMKQLSEHPWDSLPKEIEVGSKVKGKIVNVADYGAFLEIQPGVEGLIHVSEMSWSQHLRNPQDFINVGDEVEAVVLTIDREERKMSLGIKQLTEDPWTKAEILEKYAIGTRHVGVVRNLTNFGLFIELEEGIDGLVHVSDLSWTKKIKHPSEFVKVNDELEVVVMELDVENRRLALSHKHIEENPWDAFESVFTRGSEHQGTIIELNDKGARIELQYGIEGAALPKHLAKEDGSNAQVGETLKFNVLDFNKDERRISLSHTKTWKEEDAGSTEKKPAAKPARKTSKAVRNVNSSTEKTTLGELEALSALKEQMEQDKEDKIKAAAKKPSAKTAAVKKEEAPKAKAKTKTKEKASKKEEEDSEKK
ncbi:30S ribosomal protein S1 [Hyphobacterium sp. CCMP332]|nr:30S ribosomal protein S1 [Hyphobacterium sp. CCMP332]